ncbi:MAG: hypothetical protein Q8Q73_13710 [Stagnimonas sp.]|nr:hypothetical protein [Stagnimonas sp.]
MVIPLVTDEPVRADRLGAPPARLLADEQPFRRQAPVVAVSTLVLNGF